MEFTGKDMFSTHVQGIKIGVERGVKQGEALVVADALKKAGKVQSCNLSFFVFASISGLLIIFTMLSMLLDITDKYEKVAKMNIVWMNERIILNTENHELTKQLVRATWDDDFVVGELRQKITLSNPNARPVNSINVCVDSDPPLNKWLRL